LDGCFKIGRIVRGTKHMELLLLIKSQQFAMQLIASSQIHPIDITYGMHSSCKCAIWNICGIYLENPPNCIVNHHILISSSSSRCFISHAIQSILKQPYNTLFLFMNWKSTFKHSRLLMMVHTDKWCKRK